MTRHDWTLSFGAKDELTGEHWAMRRTWNDHTIEVRIRHDAIKRSVRTFIREHGDAFELLTQDEVNERQRVAREHGDEWAPGDDVFVIPNAWRDTIVGMIADALRRFDALGYVVDLRYTM